jgi:hypothetical protein
MPCLAFRINGWKNLKSHGGGFAAPPHIRGMKLED